LTIIAQCPCSGGSGGSTGRINNFAVLVSLVLVVVLWRTIRWTKTTWNQGATIMSKLGKLSLVVLVSAGLIGAVGMQFLRAETAKAPAAGLPKLIDLGAKSCIPCKKMAPILEELKKDYAGKFDVEFIDVSIEANVPLAKVYGIKLIPTQVFIDAKGKELWRHEGFLGKEAILGKWKELGFKFDGGGLAKVERWAPAKKDTRTKDAVCYMCDGDINAKTAVEVKTDTGVVRLCSPHCYFIMYSCLTEDKVGFEKKVSVTDYASGKIVAATDAAYLYGIDAKTGRPWIRAFADAASATKQRQASGGSIISLPVLQAGELAVRCGFCDRACYPADSAKVIVAGVHTWGCCAHCALGVAARTGKDIEIHQPDALTGDMIVIKTLNGQIASLSPKTAVAWFGMKKKADGKFGSAGCFHQGDFTSVENLKKWMEQHPLETGKLISIQQALAGKMKLSPQQIKKACKIGECKPK
jgi:thioredoxin 1